MGTAFNGVDVVDVGVDVLAVVCIVHDSHLDGPQGQVFAQAAPEIKQIGLAEQDAALGTGSTIYSEADHLYYTFYTGNKYQPSSSDNAEVVMVATSPDFKTWTKDRTFFLKGDDYGYSKKDFRDPFVFKGDDGVYHMIVAKTKSGKGSLAEFVSPDLKQWTSAGVFMTTITASHSLPWNLCTVPHLTEQHSLSIGLFSSMPRMASACALNGHTMPTV